MPETSQKVTLCDNRSGAHLTHTNLISRDLLWKPHTRFGPYMMNGPAKWTQP